MPNSFQKEGQIYVSKATPTGQGNGTRDFPYANMTQSSSGANVVGTGVYYIPFNNNNDRGTDRFSCIADGVVKIIGNATAKQTLSLYEVNIYDASMEQFLGIHWVSNANSGAELSRTVIKMIPGGMVNNVSSADASIYTDCILYNFDANGIPGDVYTRCIFINCTIRSAANVSGCYLDPNSSVVAAAGTNNNVDPATNVDAGKGLSIGGAPLSKFTPNGISVAPGFNSVVKEDFSLRKESPHLVAGIGPSHLRYSNTFFVEFDGGTGELVNASNTRLVAAGSSARTPLADVTTGVNSFTINSQGGMVLVPNSNGDGFATLVTNRIPFSDIPLEMTVVNIIAGLNFDTEYPGTESQISLASPHIFNNNVPDYSNALSGSAGRNPNRLTYRMRWSTLTEPDISDPSHWVTGATFVEFGWNQKPQFNQATLIGNGDPAFNVAAASNVFARWYQLQVRLRNNYYSK